MLSHLTLFLTFYFHQNIEGKKDNQGTVKKKKSESSEFIPAIHRHPECSKCCTFLRSATFILTYCEKLFSSLHITPKSIWLVIHIMLFFCLSSICYPLVPFLPMCNIFILILSFLPKKNEVVDDQYAHPKWIF